MKKLLITALLSLFVFGCEKEPTRVDVGITTFWGEAAFYVADSEGFFQQEGLKVITHEHSAGKKSLKKLYEEKIDIAHVAEFPVAEALSGTQKYVEDSDINLKIFSEMIYTSNSQKVIARYDHGIKTAQDLKNKKVGIYQGTTSEYFLDTFLLEHGINEQTIEVVNVEIPNHQKALKNGKIDAVVSWEPYASEILSTLGDEVHQLNSVLGHSTLWMATSSARYIQKHPDIIVKYLQALKKAEDYIQTHPKQGQKLIAQKTNTSRETIRKLWDSIEYELSISQRMLSLLQDQRRWLRAEKFIDDTTELTDINKALYFQALKKVNPKGLTVIR
ncbi:ABC transporter substrate-binding protein [Fodinibius saliphilus]|uniref:ABC transporter substrate-binding protein n=1 Tax=Fodinibius saliphilus TaxID=1920650 RepID=UPI0014864E64|nr:ABC transporter substrate-binding protein [Fodinibius saliphilus]